MMVAKMMLAGFVVFEDGDLWRTLATGIPSVWVFFCLVELVAPKRKLGAYLIVDLLLTSVYFAVIMYYKYFGIIVTYHAARQINQLGEVKSSVFSLMHPYFLLIYTDIVLLALALLCSRRLRSWGRSLAARGTNRRLAGAGLALSLLLCIANIVPHKDSISEIKQAEGMGILNYEAYTAFAELLEEEVDPGSVTREAIDALKGVQPVAEPAYRGIARGKNLIIIQLEAFQDFLIGMTVDGREVTPNMNRLAREGWYFPHFYQQVGQGNTSDAEFVVNTSLFIPRKGAASETFGDKVLPGLPRLLAERGYDTMTFHTNDVVFWNRKELYPALGFSRYYDRTFFGDEDVVMFGASDEVLYRKVAEELTRVAAGGRPFYAMVVSMSGHHPFNLPKRKYRMELPKRFEGTLVGDYIRAQNYADAALGEFVEQLKAAGLWDSSVVVVYGDHVGLPKYSLTAQEKKLLESERFGREYDVQDMLNIPLILHVPGTEPQVFEGVGGQVDLLPTLANLLDVPLDGQIYFGQDLLNQTGNLLPQRYYLPSGSLITDDGVFVPGKGYEDGVSYALDGGRLDRPAATEEQFERALRLLNMSNSYARSLPERKP
jgi:phosphoglycerol transferase MdoB-like AlkP superfamily enzyme